MAIDLCRHHVATQTQAPPGRQRCVSPTDAGGQLIAALRPAREEIVVRIASICALREKTAGSIRINTSRHAAQTILWPTIELLLPEYSDIRFERRRTRPSRIIVARRFDSGLRLGERVEKNKIGVRIGPHLRMAVVDAQFYLEAH